jgi:hypothetical protein
MWRVTPGWLLAVAFAATILVIGIPVYLVLRGGGEAVTTTTEVTSTIPSTTSTVPPTTTTSTVPPTTTTTTMAGPPADLAMRWSRVEDEVLADGSFAALIATDAGFVAAGGGDVWLSEDGAGWQRLAADSFGPTAELMDVAVGPNGLLVAVGVADCYPAAWTSRNGMEWEAAELGDAGSATPALLNFVTASDAGWVAVGDPEWSGGDCAGSPGSPVEIWLSPDAITWERVIEPLGAEVRAYQISEFLAWGGSFYALGYTEAPSSHLETPAVWTSADGRSWHRVNRDSDGEVEDPAGADWGAWILAGAGTDAALFAVGQQMNWWQPPNTWSLAVWRSEDGATWSLLPTEFEVPGRSTHGSDLEAIAGDGERLVAIEPCGYMWASSDRGDTWHQVAELDAASACAVWLAFDGTRFVAAGWDDTDPAVWVGEWASD